MVFKGFRVGSTLVDDVGQVDSKIFVSVYDFQFCPRENKFWFIAGVKPHDFAFFWDEVEF